MSQAQIAGGSLSPPGQCPTRGYLLRDFTLTSVEGKESHPSDYRGRSALLLLFAGSAHTSSDLLAQIACRYHQLQEEEAQALAVLLDSREAVLSVAHELAPPFPLLADEDGRVHREFGAAHSDGRPAPAIYVTDRYGEVFGSYRTACGQTLPSWQEILSWLAFINSQCPECEPPEWPL